MFHSKINFGTVTYMKLKNFTLALKIGSNLSKINTTKNVNMAASSLKNMWVITTTIAKNKWKLMVKHIIKFTLLITADLKKKWACKITIYASFIFKSWNYFALFRSLWNSSTMQLLCRVHVNAFSAGFAAIKMAASPFQNHVGMFRQTWWLVYWNVYGQAFLQCGQIGSLGNLSPNRWFSCYLHGYFIKIMDDFL